ncbi:MAG: hypothetical protein JWM65_2003 [Sphingomonas bacterium]|nr:hypothetical protein [Sphingomonas bacterium]
MIRSIAFAVSGAALLAPAAAAPAPANYAVTGTIAGPDGRWDYASFDPATGRVYVARGDSVTVIAIDHPAPARSVGAIMRGHGVLPVGPGARLLVSSGGDDSVRLIDADSGSESARIAVGGNPDAALFDAATGLAAVMNAKAGTVSVIALAGAKVARTITLKPGLEFATVAAGGALFVNNEDANEIERANITTGAVAAPIALPGCTGPSGLGYDAMSHQLISACDNGKAAVTDTVTGREIALLDIGRGPDAVIMDSKRRLAFIPCGRDGMLTIIALGTAGHAATVQGSVPTEPGARTGTIDPRDGTLYLPTAKFAPPATPGARPTAIPGTFHLVVVRRAAG